MAEDTAMLWAVEAFLQDENSPDVTDEESLPSLTPLRRLIKPRASRSINNSRVRQRQEIVILREQVKALEDRIAVAKNNSTSLSIEPARKARLLRAEAWHAVAIHEKEQLSEAESERERLRRQIKRIKSSVRRVERLLRSQSPTVDMILNPLPLMRSKPLPIASVDFSDIVDKFPSMIARVATLFADPRLSQLDSHLRDVRVVGSLDEEFSVEAIDSRVIPFDPEATVDVMWNFDKQRTQHLMPDSSEECDLSEEWAFKCLDASFAFPNFRGGAHGRVVTQKLTMDGRTVLLRQIAFENGTLLRPTAVSPFGLRIFHWTVIGPPRKAALRGGKQQMTQIDSFEIGIPTVGDSREPTRTRELMRQMAIEASGFVADVEHQGVENMLLKMTLNDDH